MNKLLYGVLLACALTIANAGEGWLTDLDAAKKQAQSEGKAILLDFTGSDWCGFCIKLKKEVFDTEEFKKFAEKNLVLVEVDFPKTKKQPSDLKKANKKLEAKYNVEVYPTIILLDAKGKKLAEFPGYEGEGAAKYIAKLQGVLAKKVTS
jgi:protein disulfide-isomerase